MKNTAHISLNENDLQELTKRFGNLAEEIKAGKFIVETRKNDDYSAADYINSSADDEGDKFLVITIKPSANNKTTSIKSISLDVNYGDSTKIETTIETQDGSTFSAGSSSGFIGEAYKLGLAKIEQDEKEKEADIRDDISLTEKFSNRKTISKEISLNDKDIAVVSQQLQGLAEKIKSKDYILEIGEADPYVDLEEEPLHVSVRPSDKNKNASITSMSFEFNKSRYVHIFDTAQGDYVTEDNVDFEITTASGKLYTGNADVKPGFLKDLQKLGDKKVEAIQNAEYRAFERTENKKRAAAINSIKI